MTAQEPLWVDPHWTDRYPPGTPVRDPYTGSSGAVVTNDGRQVTVEYRDHPYHGTYRCTYGMDALEEVRS